LPKIEDQSEDDQAESLGKWTVDLIVAHQKDVLESYRVSYDRWFSENTFYETGGSDNMLKELQAKGAVYQSDGAKFLKTTEFGDDQDRVIVTSDGRYTYFLPDIAYHKNKRERGFQRVIDILGPDHQTFPARMKAAMKALGYDESFLHVIILQQVNLVRAGEVVKMSKRSGEMVTMEELLDDVGVDAARFFFCQRKTSAHLDFDLDLAMKRTEDNPVYYVQYAHARIASIFRKSPYKLNDKPDFSLFQEPEEIDLAKKLREFPCLLQHCVETLEPQPLTGYLQEVAATYHRFYHNHRVISDNEPLSKMRLNLCRATQIVIRNGLTLLGIDAPESM
jgi:arginyl-tRNA synthetase